MDLDSLYQGAKYAGCVARHQFPADKLGSVPGVYLPNTHAEDELRYETFGDQIPHAGVLKICRITPLEAQLMIV